MNRIDRRAFVGEVGFALLAALTGWIALFAWRGLVELPEAFLRPTAVGALVLAVTGALARLIGLRWYAALGVQLVALLGFVNLHMARDDVLWGLFPTPTSMREVGDLLVMGGEALGTQYSPVPADFPGVHDTLMLSALGFLLLFDVLACGLHRVPLAGLPLLVAWMFPISLLTSGLSWVVFVVVALLFVMLLAAEETRRVLRWGTNVSGRDRRDPLDQLVSGSSIRATAIRIGLVTTAAALVVPVFVPLADLSFAGGSGPGPGDGRDRSISIDNPFLDLRRDLVRPDEFPMLDVRTDAEDPSYVRLTVLDVFSGATWRPSARHLPASQRAIGDLPPAPGLMSDVTGRTSEWDMRLLETFSTVWLPTPYPTRSISAVEGDWRYDERTLDIADAHGDPYAGDLSYSLTAFEPDVDAVTLEDAFLPPSSVREPMTELPENMPAAVIEQANRITADQPTNYRKARALQEWFREKGGFRYSLQRAPGSGLSELVDFITTERVGYCEQFAAAMAVMGRVLDIPSRVVVGWLRPEKIGENRYRFTSDDLHAWPEMYFTGIGWVRFEPTPSAQTGEAPSWTTEELPSAQQSDPSGQASEEVAPRDQPDAEQPGTSSTGGEEESGPPVLPWVVGGMVLLALVTPRVVRDAQRRARLGTGTDPPALAAGLWAELRASVVDLGIAWHPERSARQSAQALARRAVPDDDLRARLEELVQFIERARYGRPFQVDDETADRLRGTVRAWSAALAATVAPRVRRRAALFPRSVWTRGTVRTDRSDHDGRRDDELVGSGR